jgi:mono/diheme cytochrome c family protein
MRGLSVRLILLALALMAVVTASACGTYATPEWAAEAQETRAALAATDTHLTEIAPTPLPTQTALQPTETPVPPTATPVPPTATPEPATVAPATATMVPPTAPPAEPVGGAAPAGDPAAGQVVFQTSFTLPDGSQWACMACHSVTPDELRLIGPGLHNVAVRAETYPADAYGPQGPGAGGGQNQTETHAGGVAYEYIRASIINPARFIAPTKEGDAPWALQMPVGFGDLLTEQQLNDVIAYLISLQ